MAAEATQQADTPDLPNLLTGEQVARRIGISRERVRQLTGRPDFPPPVGRIGQAIAWRDSDVEKYANGERSFLVVNGVSIGIEKGRELAARLRHRELRPASRKTAAEVAAAIESLLDTGGSVRVTEAEALAVFAALQLWLEDTNVDVFGEQLMSLRYLLFGDLQDAGLIPR